MLTTEDCCDVIFRVGAEKRVVRAHRYVLVSHSCVFHAMFCGPLAEKGEVTIPDIEPNVFKPFLRYLYSDTTTLTVDTVTGLLYTSRKNAVDAPQEMCVTFLEKSLSEENVCQILKRCHGYGEVDLEQKALKILSEAGMKVIKSPGFLELCSDCSGQFLQSDELNLKEEEVFEAALSWAKEKCKEEGVCSNPENLKKILGELRYKIMFTDFTLDDQDQVIALVSNTDRKLRGIGELSNVFFSVHVPLVAGRTYIICVTMTGGSTYCGIDGQSSVTVDGVTFIFSSSKRSRYTTNERGQIPLFDMEIMRHHINRFQ